MRYGTHSRGARGRARTDATAHHGRLWPRFRTLSASTARCASNAPPHAVLRPSVPPHAASPYRPLQRIIMERPTFAHSLGAHDARLRFESSCAFERRRFDGVALTRLRLDFLGRGRRQSLYVLQDDTTRTGGFRAAQGHQPGASRSSEELAANFGSVAKVEEDLGIGTFSHERAFRKARKGLGALRMHWARAT